MPSICSYHRHALQFLPHFSRCDLLWPGSLHHQVSCLVAGTPPSVEPISFTNVLHLGQSSARSSASASDKPTWCRSLSNGIHPTCAVSTVGAFQSGSFWIKVEDREYCVFGGNCVTCQYQRNRCYAARRDAGGCLVCSRRVILET